MSEQLAQLGQKTTEPIPTSEIDGAKQPEAPKQEIGYIISQDALNFLIDSIRELKYKKAAPMLSVLEKELVQVSYTKTKKEG